MSQFEESVDWESYARSIQNSWETEHRRQTFAYQQLEIEMSKLLQLLQESQRNQNDFMIEAATFFDQTTNNYYELRQDVMSLITEARMSQNDTNKMVNFQNRLDEMINRLETIISTIPQHDPSSLLQESQQFIRTSNSLPSPTRQVQQESASIRNVPSQQFSASFAQEGRQLLQTSPSSKNTYESTAFKQESNGFTG